MFPAKSVAFRVAAAFSACLAASAAFADPPSAWKPLRPKQAVIISFDSARDISQWQRSRALAKRTGAHFTYFLSCVFLLTPETR
ncbi:MAG: polysaccharide deacetylase, partial [Mesorhizobium sp.]